MDSNDFFQCCQELPMIGLFRVLIGTLGRCGDFLGQRPHPVVPGEMTFAMQQDDEREGLGLPWLPECRRVAKHDFHSEHDDYDPKPRPQFS